MGKKRCFICCQQCFPKPTVVERSNKTDSRGPAGESKFDSQLQVMFLLRKLLEIPEDTCCKLLQHFGNPNLWIECCNSCSMLVEKCQSILCQIASLEKNYDELRMDIKYKILKSQKDFDYEYQCETIVRSQIISKDVDYFIKTTYSEKSEETSPIAENIVDVTDKLIYTHDGQYDGTDPDELHIYNTSEDPLAEETENVESGVQDTARSTIEREFLIVDFDENQRLLDHDDTDERIAVKKVFGGHEMGEEEIDIKPLSLMGVASDSKELPLFEKHDGTFKKASNIQIHKKKLIGRKLVKCSICDKRLAPGSLRHHILIHSDEKKFSCDTCGESFRHSSSLNRHIRVHSDVKQYQCDLCGQAFTRRGKLNVHQGTIHATDKEFPFVCVMCGKSLNDQQSLKSHYRQHTEERDRFFKCLICGTSFTILNALKLHSTIHSETNK